MFETAGKHAFSCSVTYPQAQVLLSLIEVVSDAEPTFCPSLAPCFSFTSALFQVPNAVLLQFSILFPLPLLFFCLSSAQFCCEILIFDGVLVTFWYILILLCSPCFCVIVVPEVETYGRGKENFKLCFNGSLITCKQRSKPSFLYLSYFNLV